MKKEIEKLNKIRLMCEGIITGCKQLQQNGIEVASLDILIQAMNEIIEECEVQE